LRQLDHGGGIDGKGEAVMDRFYDLDGEDASLMETVFEVTAPRGRGELDHDGDEWVYWVRKDHEERDEDWAIDQALRHHQSRGRASLEPDDCFASAPFSRHAKEFEWVA
jgi:hypothetical protein